MMILSVKALVTGLKTLIRNYEQMSRAGQVPLYQICDLTLDRLLSEGRVIGELVLEKKHYLAYVLSIPMVTAYLIACRAVVKISAVISLGGCKKWFMVGSMY
jgi:hypothetical protein